MTLAVKQGREDALARERLQQEMETARHIQERLLPHDQPLLAGWEVTGMSMPSLQVGGDYFDFISPGRRAASASPSATSRARACRRRC